MEIFAGCGGLNGSVESLIGGRSENQDSYGMADTESGFLVVVCDGMGGGPAGKTASSLAVNAIINHVSSQPAGREPREMLAEAAVAAGDAIDNAVADNPSLKGMGTTCVCILFGTDKACVMHIGDSRLYQLRGGEVAFRTSDHSYVGELVRRGALTEEQARTSQYSNVITRAIGAGVEINPETDVIDLQPGDRIALMTDGIWGALPEPELVKLLCEGSEPGGIVQHICDTVDNIGIQKGGRHDNLTLALCIAAGECLPDGVSVETAAVGADTPSLEEDAESGEESTEAELEEYELEEEGEEESKRSKLSVVLWSLAAVLALSIAANGYFLYKGMAPKPEPAPVADSTIAKADSVAKPPVDTAKAPEEEALADNATPASSGGSYSSYTPSYSSYSYDGDYDNSSYDDATPSSSSAASDKDREAVQSAVGKAVDVLQRLSELNPRPGTSPRDRKGLAKRRGTFVDKAIEELNSCVPYIEDNGLRGKIANAVQSLDASRGAVASERSFKEDGFSTPEAKSEINSLIAQLNSLY